MPHLKNIGNCRKCGQVVMSVRDSKDHTVGQPSHVNLAKYKSKEIL